MNGLMGSGAVRRGLVVLVSVLALAGAAARAPAAGPAPAAAATARPTYRHTIGRAMGLIPARAASNRFFDPAVSNQAPLVYHGGATMATGTTTIHTIFWAPPGYHFTGSPGGGAPGYEALVKQFFTDSAAASGNVTNVFSVFSQYGDNRAPGSYRLAYNPATDSIDDTHPYPTVANQCASPSGTATCVTDAAVSREIDRIIQATDPSGRGLNNLWEIFLPPDVDECVLPGDCGTNYFAAYHSLANLGHGSFIYAVMIDPLIEALPVQGSDPQGNPDAESTLTDAAHETVEAITDPEGTGWMDPDGFEVGDVCETEYGTPLGFAPNGSPYNQLINGHEYEIQDMWSNHQPLGCVQSSAVTNDGLPLPSIALKQFSASVSGSTGRARAGVSVQIGLVRAGELVARAGARTRASGAWGPVRLRGPRGEIHAVGDDRDTVIVSYGRGGPPPDYVETGSGGDPFAESGWTGWLDLDTGFEIGGHSVTVGPCFQTGVITVSLNGRSLGSPNGNCGTQTDVATLPTPRLTPSSRLQLIDTDNRGPLVAPFGALVSMTVPMGEPGSISAVSNFQVPLFSSGLPACDAQLRLQFVVCTGLVSGERYRLTSSRHRVTRHARAEYFGSARFSGFRIRGGEVLTLINSAGRVLTRLHVAHLRVGIDGNSSIVASGTCQPGDYWGTVLTHIPQRIAAGFGGAAGDGEVCGSSGHASGLSSRTIGQVDDLSGGETTTSIPRLEGEIPTNDAIIQGGFRALALTGFPNAHGGFVRVGARVSLSIARGGKRVFRARNVHRPGGVAVRGLPAGIYSATWVVSDRNGDTRTVLTRFEEQ